MHMQKLCTEVTILPQQISFCFCLVWIKIREFVKLILGIFTIITCLSNLCTQTLFSGHFTNRCLTVCSSIPMYFFLTSTRQPSVLIHSSAVKSFALVSVVLEFFLVWFFTVRYRCRYVQSCNNRQFPSRQIVHACPSLSLLDKY